MLAAEAGDRAVVDDHAVLVEHQAVADAALFQLRDAVDVEAVEELRGVASRDLDLAERRGVEHADAGAHGGGLALRRLRLPLVKPFETSFARVDDRAFLLVTLHGEGAEGWGECVADDTPFYSAETASTAWHVLKDFLVPMLTGVELADGRLVARTALFVRPVPAPADDALLTRLGCDVDADGCAVVDAGGRTSVFGVWAAGNVVNPFLSVIASAGAGAMAAAFAKMQGKRP